MFPVIFREKSPEKACLDHCTLGGGGWGTVMSTSEEWRRNSFFKVGAGN
jgi:hypothetical protein